MICVHLLVKWKNSGYWHGAKKKYFFRHGAENYLQQVPLKQTTPPFWHDIPAERFT
jgi:hypothetical protein